MQDRKLFQAGISKEFPKIIKQSGHMHHYSYKHVLIQGD
jgi:hypothetical protein